MVKSGYSSAPGAPRVRSAMGDAAATNSMTPEILFDMLFDFLKRRGWIAILLGLAVGAIAVYFALSFLPPTYTSTATIRISTPQDQRPEAHKENMTSYITIDEVLGKALDQQDAKALPFVQNSTNPTEVLRKWLKIESKPISDIVTVSLEGSDPKEITILVNAVVNAYLVYSGKIKSEGQRMEEADYKNQRDALNKEIVELSKAIQETAKRVNQNTVDQINHELLAKQEEQKVTNKELDDAEQKMNQAFLAWTTRKNQKAQLTTADLTTLNTLATDSRVGRLGQTIENLRKRADEEKRVSLEGEKSAEYQRMKAEIEDKENELNELKDFPKNAILKARQKEIDSDAHQLESAYELCKDHKLKCESRSNIVKAKINQLMDVLLEISPVAAKHRKALDELDRVEKKLQSIKDESGSRYVSLVSPASASSIPTRSKARLAIIGMSGVGGFALVVMIFWFMDFRLKLVTNPESLQRQLPVSVLGILPWIPKNRRLPNDSDFDDKSRSKKQWQAMQDGINSLRITLTFAPDRANDGLSSLMISSARDGEGKSTLSGSLAVSLARSGVRVILVDADLYRPVQHTTFDMPQAPGLAEVLSGAATIDQAIRETAYPNLYLLAAGSRVDHVDSLLTNERLKIVFDELKSKFATVIIDAPPVLPVYDTLLFGQQADQTIICAMCNHSQVFLLKQAQQKLESVGIPVMGVVVAGASAGSKYSYYYYSQGYQRAPAPIPTGSPKPSSPEVHASSDSPSPNGNGAHSPNGKSGANSSSLSEPQHA